MSINCHCGLPLHYKDQEIKDYITKKTNELGEFVTIENFETGKKYKVQRHYIALHGIIGKDLNKLGFEEIKD
ncbi:MAG TPA: hypothetical protein VKR58_10020 [Aquella sp.]|nr:hypothetical protein [Aquella sp.]